MTCERYTLDDSRKQREPRKYAFIILGAFQTPLLSDTFHQLNIIYNSPYFKLQHKLILPTATARLESLLQRIDVYKDY